MICIRNDVRRLEVERAALERYFDVLARWTRIRRQDVVQVVFCSIPRMRRLKADHFGRPVTTDCVSFSTGFDELAGPGPRLLGEVFICPDQVARQATTCGVTFEAEMLFVFTHGLLHLVGHDDGTPDQREAMHRLQRRLMKRGGYPGRRRWPIRWRARSVPPVTVRQTLDPRPRARPGTRSAGSGIRR